MEREESVAQCLVEMADILVADFDVIDLLTTLTARCVQLLGASAAGVMIASPGGDLRLVASSSEAMRLLEVFELEAQEGPCLDAFHSGERVADQELRSAIARWPKFASAALSAGFQSVSALPMRLRDETIGALNMFLVEPTPMDERNVVVGQAFADLATISILQHRSVTESHRLNVQLSGALTSRVVIEQAKGVVSERARVGLEDAFQLLRNYARNNNLRLTDVSQAAVDGTLDVAWGPS